MHIPSDSIILYVSTRSLIAGCLLDLGGATCCREAEHKPNDMRYPVVGMDYGFQNCLERRNKGDEIYQKLFSRLTLDISNMQKKKRSHESDETVRQQTIMVI